MNKMVIYFGDDDMTRAAAYLSGILYHYGIPFHRVDSTQSPCDDFWKSGDNTLILSDYPRANFLPGQLEKIRDAVHDGAGLIMLGGWESYHGLNGEYHDTPLAEVLPVIMLDRDDRRNFSQGVLLCREQEHPILENLPWDCPPLVGGLNEFLPKPRTRTLLTGKPLDVRVSGETISCAEQRIFDGKTYPMLVVGEYGKGRTAAFATDVAPHWVGGFVDWGKERITQKLPTGGFIEIGADYARFFAQLVNWAGA